MDTKNKILEDYHRLREIAIWYYKNKKYVESLKTISLLAKLMYNYNIIFSDSEIEKLLKEIAEKVVAMDFSKLKRKQDRIVFYDIFALDRRGLGLIYIKALINLNYEILYITYKKKEGTLGLIEQELRKSSMSQIYYIKNYNEVEQIEELCKVILEFSPAKILIYTTPNDVVGISSISLFENICERFLINLTDHAFWLGTIASDYILEFRNFGVNISLKYRGVKSEKDIIVPYYPGVINADFEGFPFSIEGKKLIFSGGSLYKTLGATDYYEIIKTILDKYQDAIFLYAGFGDDSELKKLINLKKFKNRIFHIQERRDLFEILKHSYFYLSTYPLAGGLMTQYAVAAKKLPITFLKCKNDIDELVLEPEKLNVFFEDKNELYAEIDRLFLDEAYKASQEENLAGQLVTEEEFEQELQRALVEHKTKYQYMKKETIFTKEKISDVYINVHNYVKYNSLFVSKQTLGLWAIFLKFPIQVSTGLFFKSINRIKKFFNYA